MSVHSLTAAQREGVLSVRRDISLTRSEVPFPVVLRHALEGLDEEARATIGILHPLDSPSRRSRFGLRRASARLGVLFLKMAGLSPAPSLEVGDALRHDACKLLKMAHRCPKSGLVGGLTWSAEGYFAVLGELAVAFAHAQQHREELRPVEDDSRVRKVFQQLCEELSSSVDKPPFTADAWPGDFDWLIRDVADLALLGLVPQFRAVRKAYAAARKELDLGSCITANREESASLAVAASWLDALGLVVDEYERRLV